ncbi:MAG: TolC family protein [Thermodesulfobacteriota bacterium]
MPSPSFAENNSLGLLDSVRSALQNQADIQFGELDVELAERKYQEQSGQFDTRLRTGAEHGETRRPLGSGNYADHELQKESSYHLGLEKLFRTGLVLSPELRTTRTEVDKKVPSEPSQIPVFDINNEPIGYWLRSPSSTPPPQSRSGVYLKATLPLLQGLGKEASAGLETAARQDAQIAKTELQHSISQVVQETSLAYWNYVHDYLYLKQQRQAEQRAREMYEQVQALVEADEMPEAELAESRANISEKRTQRISAEQALTQSRLDLGLAMGVPSPRIRNLPPPQDTFDLLQTSRKMLSQINSSSLIAYAVQTRHDLQASKGSQESAAIREKVYEDRTRPNLDLGMQAGYEGLEEGDPYSRMPESSTSNVRGMSWQMSLTYEFPVENREARGRLGQQRVEKRRQALQSRELSRNIQSRVHTSLSVLRQNIKELENARETVQLYKETVENQEMKFRMGMGTQLDLINTQDNLTQARLRRIESHFKCARALTELRYQTATLVSFVQDQAQVDLENLTNLPQPGTKALEN